MKAPRVLKPLTILLCAAALLPAGCSRSKNTAPPDRRISVSTCRLDLRRETITVQGTVRTLRTARIAARTPGTLEAVNADEGDAVARDSVLFETDSASLRDNLEIQRRNLEVAEASGREARAGLSESEATFEKADADATRFKKLYEMEKAVTLDAYEKIQTAGKRATAAREHSRALVALADARIEQARAAVRVADKQLSDARILAPFDGVVTRRHFDPGEYAAPGAAVIELEDPASREVEATVTGDWETRLDPGITILRVTGPDGRSVEAVLTRRTPGATPATRTIDIRATLPVGIQWPSGSLADIEIRTAERTAPAVPAEAVVQRAGSAAVFRLEDGRVKLTPVKTGLRTDGHIELIDPPADLLRATLVREGGDFLNDGDTVRTPDSAAAVPPAS
jgi:RND family efflux transporter MFP subunit